MEKPTLIQRAIKVVPKIPVFAAKSAMQRIESGVQFVQSAAEQSIELIAPNRTTAEFVHDLKAQRPYFEIECAKRAIRSAQIQQHKAMRLARRKNEEQHSEVIEERLVGAETLRTIGFAMLKKNIIRTEKSKEISQYDTARIVAETIEAGVDPEKQSFLQPEEQAEAARLIEKYQNVTIFPKLHENEL